MLLSKEDMKLDQPAYTVERLNAANIRDLVKLHKAVYNRSVSRIFFKNKYDTAYAGVEHVGFIAYNNTRLPIAFYGVIPCLLQYQTDLILAAQSADTMTHPDYQGLGLFTRLAKQTFELCKEKHIRLLFGFPNQNSLPGFVKKLGWEVTEVMDCFTIPVGKIAWDVHAKKIFPANWIYNNYVLSALKKYLVNQSGVANSAIQDGFDGVYRDESHLKYKHYSKSMIIKAGNALLWVKINNGLIIGDICLFTDDFDSIMHEVKKLASRIGVKQIYFHSSPGTPLHKLFNDRYNAVRSFPIIFKHLGNKLSTTSIKFTTADIDTF